MLFLTSNQHCQSTEGESKHWRQKTKQCEQRKMTNRHNIEQCYLSRRSYIALTSDQLYRWQPWPVTQPRASVQSAACVVHRRMYLAASNARSLDEPASLPLRTAALRCRGAFSCTQFTHKISTIGDWQRLEIQQEQPTFQQLKCHNWRAWCNNLISPRNFILRKTLSKLSAKYWLYFS